MELESLRISIFSKSHLREEACLVVKVLISILFLVKVSLIIKHPNFEKLLIKLSTGTTRRQGCLSDALSSLWSLTSSLGAGTALVHTIISLSTHLLSELL